MSAETESDRVPAEPRTITLVEPGNAVVTDDPTAVLATPAMGSSVAVAFYDSRLHVAGLLHFLLPDSALDPTLRSDQPELFADSGIELLIHQVEKAVGVRDNLVSYVVGGSDPLIRNRRDFELILGKRNWKTARRLLEQSSIGIKALRVGGSMNRRFAIEVGTGAVHIIETPDGRAR